MNQNDKDSYSHCISLYFQVLSLKDSELNWICDHLGHSKKVHLAHYRQLSGTVERIQIAKLMMIQDMNLSDRFKGQSLSEIQFEGIIIIMSFYAPEWNLGVSSFCPVCSAKNFNLGHNFWIIKHIKGFIFGMYTLLMKPFPMVMNLWPWPWPLLKK